MLYPQTEHTAPLAGLLKEWRREMRKDWQYGNTASVRVGLMICGACGGAIEGGEYRYRMHYSPDGDSDKDRFVTHHRRCSEKDPGWAKLDADRAARAMRQAAFLSAAIAFRDAWQVTDLDDLISDLEQEAAATGEAP